MAEAWPVFRLWLEKGVQISEMTGPAGCNDRLSIDDVANMCDALDEWNAASERMQARDKSRNN